MDEEQQTAAGARPEKPKKNLRNGVSKSLYISRKANDLLWGCRRSTRRSQSEIVSLLVERYGPAIARDPRMLQP